MTKQGARRKRSPEPVNTKKSMDPFQDAQRATVYNAVETLEYSPNAVVTRKMLNKSTGTVTVLACDVGATLDEKISAFDTLVMVLDGSVKIRIDNKRHRLTAGQCIIMPAHFRNHIQSEVRFKILLTVIKSGYENSN